MVLRTQSGDEKAFSQLHKQFHQSTLRFLRSLIKDDNVFDLNQEVWISVFKKISTLNDVSRFKHWLFQITRNQAMDSLRRNKRTDYFDDLVDNELAQSDTVNEENLDLKNHRQISQARENLSSKLNEVVELYYFQGMDYKEVALIVGCSIGTIKSRLHGARKKMKDYIYKNYENYEKSEK